MSRTVARRAVLGLLATAALLSTPGCQGLGALIYYFRPRQFHKPEVKLADRVAIFIEYARAEQNHPLFSRTLYDRIVELWREQKIKAEVVPFQQAADLQRSEDFADWSLQRVGRHLGAEQVLYIRVEELFLRRSVGAPIVEPSVALRVKLIGTTEPAPHARLWPAATEGQSIAHHRDPQDAPTMDAVDAAAVKLARETAYFVARNFYRYDLEEKPPRER